MGLFLVNVQVRTASSDDLPAAAKAVCRGQSRVAPTGYGWAGVYNERLDAQDEREIARVGKGLSRRLHARAIAFLVHDSDALACWTFDCAKVVDAYTVSPQDFAAPPNPDATATAFAATAPADRRAVREALAGPFAFAEQRLQAIAACLGIDAEAACNFAEAASLPGVVEVGGRRRTRRPRAAEFAMLVRGIALSHLPCESADADPTEQSRAEAVRLARHMAEIESWENHVPPDADALLAAAARVLLDRGASEGRPQPP